MQKNTHYKGLTDTEVQASTNKYGRNILTPAHKETLWKKFLHKLSEPLIVILLVAGVLSMLISLYEYFGSHAETDAGVFIEPGGIFLAILLATGLAFYFEVKADKEFELLNQVNDEEAVRVARNGTVVEIPRKDVVVGDIVFLGTGDDIPADGKLLEAVSLQVDESSLTGEPICTKTTVEADFDSNATFPSDYVLKGTKVMEGNGVMQVQAVGDLTENGKVFTAVQIDNSVKTPLNEQLEGLARKISLISYTLAALIVIGRIGHFFFIYSAWDWTTLLSYLLQTLMLAVTLIVVAVPEGLPMAVTLSLAYSMRRMLKSNNLVRKMHACETMGAITVICTDKTGTLTQNQMRVSESHFFSLPEQKIDNTCKAQTIAEGIAVNTTAMVDFTDTRQPKVMGNPTEGALLLWLHAGNVDFEKMKAAATVLEVLPFTTERKYMATVVRSAITGKKTLYVKGAPEIVLGLCKRLDGQTDRQEVERMLLEYQNQAMRTLAFAYQELDEADNAVLADGIHATDLCLMGFVAIADPVRSDVPEAVSQCLNAGVSVKIVTGDTVATAREIGRRIGLWTNEDGERNIITGPEFAALSDDELRKRIPEIKIISRARPMDKKRLVELLQETGQVVAVTGDGTNDAPALKAAHVGLSMGDGTSVAKEASDITIIDNSFTSINRAVMWGRSLYKNIQRFILFQITVNVVACLIVLIGAFTGEKSPITVTQMLWVNLIMDTFAAMALASLPPSTDVMKDKPRNRKAFIISQSMWKGILSTATLFTILLLGLLWIFRTYGITSLTDISELSRCFNPEEGLTSYELSLFFTIFVMLQFWNMFNAKAFETGHSVFHFKNSREFLLVVLFILIGQVAIVCLGGRMFNVVPLKLADWLIIIAGTSLVLWVHEIRNLFKK